MSTNFIFLPPQTDATRKWAAQLQTALPGLNFQVADNLKMAEHLIGSADAVFGYLPPELLAKAKRLRWLQAHQAAPPAGFYYPELISHPVIVTNFREIYNDHLGAHIMAFVLAFARGLHTYLPQQLRSRWSPPPLDTGVIHLPDATALIVGVGGIGAETARLAAAFGIRTIGVDARRTDPPLGMAELFPADALEEQLQRADFVILTVPHTPKTEGMMNRARFQKMKPGAFFINVGRGKTTRLDDLVEAIGAGEIAGAGLDVFEEEPLPANHPLWTLPGVLITPHTGGYGPYLDARRYEIILQNCRAFLKGEALQNVVDKALWF
jgi:phosphoglycerate dehydrogenase-like enzyme